MIIFFFYCQLLDFLYIKAKEAEYLLEDIEGSIVLGDRGYWVMKLIEKMKEKEFNLYVRPRGKGGKRLLIVIRKTSNICDIILSNTDTVN